MTLRRKMLSMSLWTSLVGASMGCPNPPPEGGVDAAVPDAPTRACTDRTDCDDNVFCNGEEQCVSGRCAVGTAPRCTDEIACTSEFCSEEIRGCVVRPIDADNDGHAAATCLDARGMALGDDCDDNNARVFPGALELCDIANVDEDCDPTTHGGLDADGDGFEDARCCNGATCGNDCNDAVRGANPMAVEVCNLIDDDCDGNIDEGVSVAGFVDMDGDGRGDPARPRTACGSAAQFSVYGDDCDDNNSLRSPTLPEVCDGQDNDCVGVGDAGASAATWYLDLDGDGFGSSSETRFECARPVAATGAYVLLGTDCDDANPSNNPAQPERCDGVDNDCNGVADFVIAPGNLEDDDRDGIADVACTPIAGTDCDDRDPLSGPGSIEVCDGRDNDCNGVIDDGVISSTFYRDLDGDGFGSAASGVIIACASFTGYVRRGNDCNDRDAARFPGAPELCNGIDDDCSGIADDFTSNACPAIGGFSYACVRGACRSSGCMIGRGECDGNPTTVCEADITSVNSCGATCAVCGVGQSCGSTGCSPSLARGWVVSASDSGIADIVPVSGTGPGSTDAFVAVNLIGQATFGLALGGGPYTLGEPGSQHHGALLRVARDGTVLQNFLVPGDASIVALASTATHVYFLGTYVGATTFGPFPVGPSTENTVFIATMRLSDWTLQSVATFAGEQVTPTGLALASDGTLAVIGTYVGTPTLGTLMLPNVEETRPFIATLPSAGTTLRNNFSAALALLGNGTAHAEAITSIGTDFFIAGDVSGSIELNMSTHTTGEGVTNAWVARLRGGDVDASHIYVVSGTGEPRAGLHDIVATSAGNLIAVGDVYERGSSSPIRITLPPTLSPVTPTVFPSSVDPMASLTFERVATRGAELIQAGRTRGAYGSIVSTERPYESVFFGSTDGVSALSGGRVFGTYGMSAAQALAIDPDDGAIWVGGQLNHPGKGREFLSLDGTTFEVQRDSAFVFVFNR